LTPPEDVAEGECLFDELRAGRRHRYQRERRYLRKDGAVVWAQEAASAIRNEKGELLYIISMVQDITEQKRITEALQRSERNLRLISENAKDVIFAFDMQREAIYINPAVEELTGYTFVEIQRRKFVNWIHPDDQPRMLALWNGLYQGKSYSDVEFRLITKAGLEKWCSSTWGPVFDELGKQVGVQGRERDVSERKQLEKEILEISANERRRVGHELHDGLGQFLAGIAFKTKALEHVLAAEKSTHASDAGNLVALISTAISQARNLARGLDPIEVETIGLTAALQNLCAETRKMFDLECELVCVDTGLELQPQTSLALYRIVQEAIHNATTHGGAANIRVELEPKNEHLILTVEDDGAGFEQRAVTSASGMGLRVMRYRAHSIGGEVKVVSRPGDGAQIICSVPLANALAKTLNEA
jgi:PAS domain S-box-containing protein